MKAYLDYLARHPSDTPSDCLNAVGVTWGARTHWRRVPAFKHAESAMRLSPEACTAWLLYHAVPLALGHALDTMQAGQGRTSIDAANLILRESHAQQADRTRSKLVEALERAISPGSELT